MLSPTINRGPNPPRTPLTVAIRDRILHGIVTGEFMVGAPLPSERELSDRLLASRTVIRAAILDLTLEGHLLSRPRCRPIVAEIGERPSMTRQIAIRLWPSSSDFIASQILKGIQRAAPDGTRLMVANVGGEDWDSRISSEDRFLRSLIGDPSISGAILWYLGGDANRQALNQLRLAGVPLVLIDREAPEASPTDFVGTDNLRSAQRAVEHLVKLGHRRIGLISNCDTALSVRSREFGYRRALSDAGIPFDPDLFFRDRVDEPEGVEEGLDRLLGQSEPPTAIFCINDHIALQAYESLNARGVSIPGQLSLIGFDGMLRWIPGGGYLTSMRQDFERMGEIAVDLLFQSGQRVAPAVRHVLLDAPLMDQGSTHAIEPTQTLFIDEHTVEVNQ